jgi:hypothetical protein
MVPSGYVRHAFPQAPICPLATPHLQPVPAIGSARRCAVPHAARATNREHETAAWTPIPASLLVVRIGDSAGRSPCRSIACPVAASSSIWATRPPRNLSSSTTPSGRSSRCNAAAHGLPSLPHSVRASRSPNRRMNRDGSLNSPPSARSAIPYRSSAVSVSPGSSLRSP